MLPSDELGLGLSPKPARPSYLGGPSRVSEFVELSVVLSVMCFQH